MADKPLVTYSSPAIRKAVLKQTLTHPLSVYASTLGVLGVVGAALFSSPAALAGGGAALTLGVGSWIINYFFRHDSLTAAHLRMLHRKQQEEIAQRPKKVQARLETMGFHEGAEQMAKLQQKFDHLSHVLLDKFEPTELAFMRYLGVAEQVYLSALDNLENLADQVKSVATIDMDYIHRQMNRLDDDAAERAPLMERMALRDKVMSRVREGLLDNEKALTTLDSTAVKIAAVNTRGGQSSIDLDTAMKDLMAMADRARHYEKGR